MLRELPQKGSLKIQSFNPNIRRGVASEEGTTPLETPQKYIKIRNIEKGSKISGLCQSFNIELEFGINFATDSLRAFAQN